MFYRLRIYNNYVFGFGKRLVSRWKVLSSPRAWEPQLYFTLQVKQSLKSKWQYSGQGAFACSLKKKIIDYKDPHFKYSSRRKKGEYGEEVIQAIMQLISISLKFACLLLGNVYLGFGGICKQLFISHCCSESQFSIDFMMMLYTINDFQVFSSNLCFIFQFL